jgi:hypothetical protein
VTARIDTIDAEVFSDVLVVTARNLHLVLRALTTNNDYGPRRTREFL